jgi:hypothetical protein
MRLHCTSPACGGGRRARQRNCAPERGGWGKLYPLDEFTPGRHPHPNPPPQERERGRTNTAATAQSNLTMRSVFWPRYLAAAARPARLPDPKKPDWQLVSTTGVCFGTSSRCNKNGFITRRNCFVALCQWNGFTRSQAAHRRNGHRSVAQRPAPILLVPRAPAVIRVEIAFKIPCNIATTWFFAR